MSGGGHCTTVRALKTSGKKKLQRERFDGDDDTRHNRSFSFAQLRYLLFHACVRVRTRV